VWNPQLFPKYFAAAATPLAVDGKLDQFGHPGQADKCLKDSAAQDWRVGHATPTGVNTC